MNSSTSNITARWVLRGEGVVNNNASRRTKGKVELKKSENQALVKDGKIFTLTSFLPNITDHIF